MPMDEQTVEDPKRQQQLLKTTAANMRGEAIVPSLLPDLLRLTMQARDKGAGSWLNAVPLAEQQDLTLNKQQFRDSVRLRFNMQLADLPRIACVEIDSQSATPCCVRSGVLLHKDMASRTFSHLCSVKSARITG